MRAAALALAAAALGAAQPTAAPTSSPTQAWTCPFAAEDPGSNAASMEKEMEMGAGDLMAWGGFPGCRHLRCDAATGALWLNVQKEKLVTFRDDRSKGHTKVERSYCMVLTPDGRSARYGLIEMKQREERWMWREKRKIHWADVGVRANATAPCRISNSLEQGEEGACAPGPLAPTWYGQRAYDACLAQCPCAASADQDDFPALQRALLDEGADAVRTPSVCFETTRAFWFDFGWITGAHWCLIFVLACSILGAWTLGCCVSVKGCYGFGALQRVRNEFADSCPALTVWLRRLCVAPCKFCSRWCSCCCKAKRPPAPPDKIQVAAAGPPGTPMTVVCPGGSMDVVVPPDVEEGMLFAVNPLVTQVITTQPGITILEDDGQTKARSLVEQFRLLVWKVYWTKRRDTSSLVKQVLGPALVMVVVWLLYVAGGLTFVPSLRWNPKNPNFKWKKGGLRDYRKGQVLSHGTLELYLGFIGFIPFVQVVIVSIVEEHGSRLVEYMKMAGLRPQAYWLAQFVSEGVFIGGLSAFMVALVSFPGLFSFAGHHDVPFFALLGLHWTYLLALVSVGFAAAALVPNALVASLFALVSQVAGVVCYFVGAWREKANGAMTATSVWNKSPTVQRWYALYPQFAYMLLVEGFQSHRKKRCQVWGAFEGEAYVSKEYGCWAPSGRSLDEAKGSALRGLDTFLGDASCPAFDALWEGSYSYSYDAAYGGACADHCLTCAGPGENNCLTCAEGWTAYEQNCVAGLASCGVHGPYSTYPGFYDPATGAPTAAWTSALYGMLLLDCALFLVLAWYFQQVVPWSEFGTPRPWYFPLLPSTYLQVQPAKVQDSDDESEEDPPCAYEERSKREEPVVVVRGLRKTFGEFRAVDGVSFEMVEGEVFCLLGHNGAGKTTTINVLSGLLPPDPASHKAAVVYGKDVADPEAIHALRQKLGVCPQHDVLFPHLTVREHVAFFGQLKGRDSSSAERDADALLEVFRLSDRSHHLGSELSGGQKRKLSVSIALSGSSKFIVLDEPTAGMDPVARRELWTLLRAVRLKRALLLTTHHMDEAEALGDRVAIMASGKVRADGSVPFLKRAFGKGYAISFEARDAQQARSLMAAAAPSAAVEDIVDASVAGFHTNAAKAEYVRSWSSHSGSFSEDLAKMKEEDGSQRMPRGNVRCAFSLPLDKSEELPALFGALRGIVDNVAFSTTTLEDVFLAVGEDEAVHNVAKINENAGAYLSLYEGDTVADVPRSLVRHSAAVLRLRGTLARNDLMTLLLPVQAIEYVLWALYRVASGSEHALGPISRLASRYVVGARALILAVLPSLGAIVLCMVARDGSLSGSERKWGFRTNILLVLPLFGIWVLVPGLVAEPIVKERKHRLRNLLAVSGLDHRAYWLGSLLGDLVPLLLGVSMTLVALYAFGVSFVLTKTELRTTFDDDALYGLVPEELKLPACMEAALDGSGDYEDCLAYVRERRTWVDDAPQAIAVYLLFPPALIAFAHLLSYSFLDPFVCVGATPVYVIGLLILPLAVVIFLCLAFGGWMPGSSEAQLFTWNGPEAMAAFAWLGSCVSPPNVLVFTLLRVMRMPFVATKGNSPEVYSPTWPPYWALCLILVLQFLLFEGLAYVKDCLDTRPLPYTKTRFSTRKKNALDPDVLTERERVLDLFEDTVDEGQEAEDVQTSFVTRLVAKATAVKDALMDELSDPNYYAPRIKQSCAPTDKYGLNVREVRKVFAPKRHGQRAVEAVKGVTFGVREGEVFGLLGANGAGKTTTMSCVMRAVEPTSGDIAISGTSVLSAFGIASEHLAVVNQNNTLWDALSCEDHLKLFARLRMRESEVADAVKATLERVELMPHADKPAGRLSGGMKRKLCGACALIGDPKIVLLDEPSAGLDPVSQRNLWNLIKATMASRAVVLTTHSMVEADFLCDRIGIMVQGQLKCLGTSDHLKQRYASGYELVVKIEDGALDGISSFVKEKFGATLAAADAGTLTYELSASSEKSADLLADAFEAFDDATRSKLKVAEFSVVQASLEKVFIRIVSGEGGEHEARDAHLKSIQVARDLGDDSDDDLDNFLFVERTCCNCSYFAHGLLCKYHSSCCCGMCTYMMLYIFGAPFVWFNTCTLTLLIHMFAALVNCVGRCCLQEPKAED